MIEDYLSAHLRALHLQPWESDVKSLQAKKRSHDQKSATEFTS